MAKQKLTLHLDEPTITKAKQIAALRGTSVSAMFSNWIRSISVHGDKPHIGPITRQACGLAKLSPADCRKTDRQLIEKALIEKYGSSRGNG